MSTLARDGYGIDPIEIGRPIIERPFRLNGDSASLIIKRRYKQIAEYFTPLALKTPDVQYPTAYLIAETDPEPTITGLVEFARTYAHIPAQQIVPSSMFITKPPLASFAGNNGTLNDQAGLGFNTTSVNAYEDTVFAAGQGFAVTDGTATQPAPTGGTFTLSYLGSTTAALASDASAATIASALNGLSSISGAGLTVTTVISGLRPTVTGQGSSLGFAVPIVISGGVPAGVITMNASNLTPSAATLAYTFDAGPQNDGTYVQIPVIMWRANIPAHGFTAGTNLIVHRLNFGAHLWALLKPAAWSVVDADNIAFFAQPGNVLTAWDRFGVPGGISYTEGTVNCRVKRVTDFYLPGVTPGISTVDDIPLATNQGTPAALVGAILAGSTSINYEVGELRQWRDGPILARTITTLNASQL